jgi:hypothetical protein
MLGSKTLPVRGKIDEGEGSIGTYSLVYIGKALYQAFCSFRFRQAQEPEN